MPEISRKRGRASWAGIRRTRPAAGTLRALTRGLGPATRVLGSLAALGLSPTACPPRRAAAERRGAGAARGDGPLRAGAPRGRSWTCAPRPGGCDLFTQPLGHLKQQARLTRDPDELARLATASDPSVVRNALINPGSPSPWWCASRRAARPPEPLVELWKCSHWSPRPAVRRALVFNPYLPPELGAKIVPLLRARTWRSPERQETRLRAKALLLLRGPFRTQREAPSGGSGR